MIEFNKDSVFNLRPIDASSVRKDVLGLLVNGEEVIMAFKTVRDQLVFTNKRIISIDVQGVTGLKRTFATLPYSRIQFFTVETPGFGEIFADTKLDLMFSNGFTARFEIRGSCDIGLLSRAISAYVLTK